MKNPQLFENEDTTGGTGRDQAEAESGGARKPAAE